MSQAAKTAPARAPTRRQDLLLGLAQAHLWLMLGWNDIRQRYRRSVLGPFWITLSMAILITALGVIYSQIFKIALATYLPYLALGFIVWGFIAGAITECCQSFNDSAGIIRQINLPSSAFVLRTIWRNFIVFLHTLVLLIPISLIFGLVPQPAMVLAIPGIVLLYLNQIWIGIFVAVLSTRFRDVPLLVAAGVQIATFATPIMWPVSALGDRHVLVEFNPLYHLIEIVRAPLLGQYPLAESWIVTTVMAVVGLAAAAALLNRVSRRIVFWL